MTFAGIDISRDTISFFDKEKYCSYIAANTALEKITGIVSFFEREDDFFQLQQILKGDQRSTIFDRIEYGDYQTNIHLANSICSLLHNKNISPKILIEPTCGKGHFIMSAIRTFPSLQQIFGIEIQLDYLWQLKFEILDYFLSNPAANKPRIRLYHCNVFEFDFGKIKDQINGRELLILGNPPWATNATLSSLNSLNLPKKSNLKRLNGIDAITGKGNFDIGEFISLKMIDLFSDEIGYFAFLIKNSVVKNIVFEQKRHPRTISNIEKHIIDAKKEFGVAVDASLFVCRLNSTPEYTAKECDFYTSEAKATWGWANDNFSSDIDRYLKFRKFDGICPIEWRQGIKHDCSKVMELERINGGFRNSLGEEFELEEDLVYGLLKSSDLKESRINSSRKYTIVTQKQIGQETHQILEKLPKTRAYLQRHRAHFSSRKSSIYNGKPLFSIFGVGDYSFKPYKVAISGFYKQTRFSLVEPNGTVLMLDDTCYFIGFDVLEDALITQFLLNRPDTQEFINSFMFADAKRVITKELLMRIDFLSIYNNVDYSELPSSISRSQWYEYKDKNLSKTNYQMCLFQ